MRTVEAAAGGGGSGTCGLACVGVAACGGVEAEASPRVVLTTKLAARLLAELLEAFRTDSKLDDAREAVGCRWGFQSAAEMTSCIEAQANASYISARLL